MDYGKNNIDSIKRELFIVGMLGELNEINQYYINSKSDYIIAKKTNEEENSVNMIKEIEQYVKDNYGVVLKKYSMTFKKKLGGVL